eukprot:gene13818-15263_t
MGTVVSFFSDEKITPESKEEKEETERKKKDENSTKPFEKSFKSATQTLKAYLNGENYKKARMGLTLPVLCNTSKSKEHGMVFSMPIPSDYVGQPVAPTLPELFIEEQAAKIVYVAVIKGAVKEEDDWLSTLDGMVEELKFNKEIFDDDCYQRAVYDENMKSKHAQNEVWVTGAKVEQEYVCLKVGDDDDNDESGDNQN